MSVIGLHQHNVIQLPERPGAGVYVMHQLGAGNGNDLGAASLGLIHLLHTIADPGNRDGLVLSRIEVTAIEAGLRLDATITQRREALRVIADNHADWTATEEGRSEVERFVAWIAPYCTAAMLAEIVATTTGAESGWSWRERDDATNHLHSLLHDAVTGTDPGPGAA